MTTFERIEGVLYGMGIKVYRGRRARCHFSISCYTPPFCGRLGVISINPEIDDPPRQLEALAVQYALIRDGGGPRRFRVTAANYGGVNLARAWRAAARICIPDDGWDAAMAARVEGHEIESAFGVTPRLVRLRWGMWAARSGNLGPMVLDRVDASLTNREPERLWCDVV